MVDTGGGGGGDGGGGSNSSSSSSTSSGGGGGGGGGRRLSNHTRCQFYPNAVLYSAGYSRRATGSLLVWRSLQIHALC